MGLVRFCFTCLILGSKEVVGSLHTQKEDKKFIILSFPMGNQALELDKN